MFCRFCSAHALACVAWTGGPCVRVVQASQSTHPIGLIGVRSVLEQKLHCIRLVSPHCIRECRRLVDTLPQWRVLVDVPAGVDELLQTVQVSLERRVEQGARGGVRSLPGRPQPLAGLPLVHHRNPPTEAVIRLCAGGEPDDPISQTCCSVLSKKTMLRRAAQLAIRPAIAGQARGLITVGSKFPSVNVHKASWPPTDFNVADHIAGKKVVVVGLPGAFTPT
jgi:hypothetical protein